MENLPLDCRHPANDERSHLQPPSVGTQVAALQSDSKSLRSSLEIVLVTLHIRIDQIVLIARPRYKGTKHRVSQERTGRYIGIWAMAMDLPREMRVALYAVGWVRKLTKNKTIIMVIN